MTTTFPELTAEQIAQALRAAKPADPDAVQRALRLTDAVVTAAFDLIRSVAS